MTLNSIIKCYCNLRDKVQELIDNAISKSDIQKSVYFYDNINSGVVEKIWSLADAVAHGDASSIFTGISSNVGLGSDISLPSHPNSPNLQSLVLDWIDNTANDPSNGTDQFEYASYIFIDNDNTQLRDANANTGERFRVWVGECCSSPKIVYERTTDTGSGDTGSGGTFVTLNKGWHLLAVQGSDLSAFAGIQIQESTDGLVWTNFSGGTSITKPQLVCKQEACDYVLQSGEFECLPICNAQGSVAENSGDLDEQVLSTALDACGEIESITISNGNTVQIPLVSISAQSTRNAFLNVPLTDIFQVIPFNVGTSTSSINAALAFTHDGNGTYTYTKADPMTFQVSYHISGLATNAARSAAEHAVFINTTQVTWLTSYSYHRVNNNDGHDTASVTANLTLTQGDTINVRSRFMTAGDGIDVLAHHSHLTITKI